MGWDTRNPRLSLWAKMSTRMGFEPTRAEHIGLAVQRLNHSATLSSWSQLSPPCQSSLPGWAFSKFIECTRYGRFDTRYSSRCWKVRYLGIRQLSETISYSLLRIPKKNWKMLKKILDPVLAGRSWVRQNAVRQQKYEPSWAFFVWNHIVIHRYW